MNSNKLSISPQGETIYSLLLKENLLPANEIGKKLHILPHAVYRAIKPLIKLGLIEKLDTYPMTFQVKPVSIALDSYLLSARSNFLQTFFSASNNQLIKNHEKILDISFIQDRSELLESSNVDINKATNKVNHIVSGLEVPADTMLEINNAIERGVKIKFLVQRLDEINKEMLKNWKQIGIEVKYFPSLEARIIIIDEQITYITSYNAQKKEEAIGVRFCYAPIANLMNDLFNQRWQLAKELYF